MTEPVIDLEWIGEVFTELALDAGYNNYNIAKATGLSVGAVQRALSGRVISLSTMVILSNFLDVSLDWLLLGRTGDKNPSAKSAAIDHIIWSELNNCDLKTKLEVLDLMRVVKRHHKETLIM